MDLIKNYVENMFKELPATTEIKQAKTNLLEMMKHRYDALIIEGATPNTAMAEILLSYGDLNMIAPELGIATILESQTESFKNEELASYLVELKSFGRITALCLAIITWAAAQLLYYGFGYNVGIAIIYIMPVFFSTVMFFVSLAKFKNEHNKLLSKGVSDDGKLLLEEVNNKINPKRKWRSKILIFLLCESIIFHFLIVLNMDYYHQHILFFVALYIPLILTILVSMLVLPEIVERACVNETLGDNRRSSILSIMDVSGGYWLIVSIIYLTIQVSYRDSYFYEMLFYGYRSYPWNISVSFWVCSITVFLAFFAIRWLIGKKQQTHLNDDGK